MQCRMFASTRTVRRPARAAGQCRDETGDGRVAVTVLCGDIRMAIFWRGGVRRALAHSLKGDRPSDEAPNSARFLNSTRGSFRNGSTAWQARASKPQGPSRHVQFSDRAGQRF
jgi:hypothetical protein